MNIYEKNKISMENKKYLQEKNEDCEKKSMSMADYLRDRDICVLFFRFQ